MPAWMVDALLYDELLVLSSEVRAFMQKYPRRWRSLPASTWERLWDLYGQPNNAVLLVEVEQLPLFGAIWLPSSATATESLFHSAVERWHAAADEHGVEVVAEHCGFVQRCDKWLACTPKYKAIQARYLELLRRIRLVLEQADAEQSVSIAHQAFCYGTCGMKDQCNGMVTRRIDDDFELAMMFALDGITLRYEGDGGSKRMAHTYAHLFIPCVPGPRVMLPTLPTTKDGTKGRPTFVRPLVSRYFDAVYHACPDDFIPGIRSLIYDFVAHTYDENGLSRTGGKPLAEVALPHDGDSCRQAWADAVSASKARSEREVALTKQRDAAFLKRHEFLKLPAEAQAKAQAKARAKASVPTCARKIMSASDFKTRRRRKRSAPKAAAAAAASAKPVEEAMQQADPKRQRVAAADGPPASDKDEKVARVVATVHQVVEAMRASHDGRTALGHHAVASAAIAAAAMSVHAAPPSPDATESDDDSDSVMEIPAASWRKRPAAAAAAAEAAAETMETMETAAAAVTVASLAEMDDGDDDHSGDSPFDTEAPASAAASSSSPAAASDPLKMLRDFAVVAAAAGRAALGTPHSATAAAAPTSAAAADAAAAAVLGDYEFQFNGL
jgi:hypothetical protein